MILDPKKYAALSMRLERLRDGHAEINRRLYLEARPEQQEALRVALRGVERLIKKVKREMEECKGVRGG